jgi:uncharacterized SAM-binding protein YcdF (DUF218 family)
MKKWLYFCSTLISISIILFIWLGFKIEENEKSTANGQNDILIILGAKVKEGGVPSLSLKNRLDVAYDYLVQYPHVQAVVSGGQGKDEDQTEASAMYTYLVNKGIEPTRILLEEHSTSTYENLLFTKQLLSNELTQATIVSNDFHLTRAAYLANMLDIEVDTLAAKTPAVVETKSRIRERAALLKTYILGK